MLHRVTSTDAFRTWMTTDFQPSQTNCCVFHMELLWLDPHSLVIVMDHCDHSQITFHQTWACNFILFYKALQPQALFA